MSVTLTFFTLEERKTHLEGLINIPSINPKKYDDRTLYNRLDFLMHTDFGAGFVDRVTGPNTICVFFNHGVEELRHNTLRKIA